MKASRLPAPAGRLIDREQPIDFTFEGRGLSGFKGDTIASALVSNGHSVLSRSFKYHRPRGVLSMAGQDANTLVKAGKSPNQLADRLPIEPGLAVTAQNYMGSLERDRMAALGRLQRFLPVGFYYKAFYKPRWTWKYWAKLIRRVAGLGTVDTDTPHGYYDKAYLFYDVAVVGGGPAGMAAALQAADAGARVVLIDENAGLGGSLNYARFDGAGERAGVEREGLAAKIERHDNIDVMTESVCTGWYADNWLPVVRANRLYKLRATALVIASGCFEQPLVFRNNDLPGVVLGSAAQRLIHLYGVKPGERAVVTTVNGDGYGVALDLAEAGVEVACLVDLRVEPTHEPRVDELNRRHIPVLVGATVWEAVPDADKSGVAGARVARITGEGRCAETADTFACDLIAVCGGYAPSGALLLQSGGRILHDGETATFTAEDFRDHVFTAGSLCGTFGLDAVIEEGRSAGWQAASHAGHRKGLQPTVTADRESEGQNYAWPIFPHPDGKDFVDFDEDLQVQDIENAIAEGYEHIELLKRFTTNGMGPSQGRHSALPAVRLLSKARGDGMNQTGFTTLRPPVTPVKMGHLAGRSFEPVRYTAMHFRHLERGAKMMPAGLWMRPEYYGDASKREELILAEAKNVRENVGLIDVSTLGGLEVRGPDAAEFMNRMYTFAYLKQPVGRARYVLMTDVAGVIVDDGVACRISDDRFYVTATTSGVDAVYRLMLWYNAQWRLKIDVTNVTAALAGVNIAGPESREVLAKLCDDVDLSADAFPYMGVRQGHVAGIPALLLRVGFVGELGYELHVPASQGEALWDALIEAGATHDIRPFGVEAQRLLRLEKGHIIISQDTDGLTTPHEADMAWAIARKKPYYVGKRSVTMQEENGITRKLVGFEITDKTITRPKEAHLVIRDGTITGRITSVAYSPVLEKIVGLAYVAPDQDAPGSTIEIKGVGGVMVSATVVKLPFYDPDNQRQEM